MLVDRASEPADGARVGHLRRSVHPLHVADKNWLLVVRNLANAAARLPSFHSVVAVINVSLVREIVVKFLQAVLALTDVREVCWKKILT